MRILKQRKLYEGQMEQLQTQSFNMEQGTRRLLNRFANPLFKVSLDITL